MRKTIITEQKRTELFLYIILKHKIFILLTKTLQKASTKVLWSYHRRRSLFTNCSKPIMAHVNIQVQYYTKQNITRGIQTTYINDKCINI